MKLLNIGCGTTFHQDWINLDAAPASPAVRRHDVGTGLPFPDGHFGAIYASHVLEHFDPEDGGRLLRDCLRVLAPGGIARVVVPNLEAIARAYLEYLEEASGSREAEMRYDWVMLERAVGGGSVAHQILELVAPGGEDRLRHDRLDGLLDVAGGVAAGRDYGELGHRYRR